MATAAFEDGKSDVFNCTICLERFTKPKYLPCLHTFCEACLKTYIISIQSGKYRPGHFPCPVCRQDAKSPDSKAPIEEWAKLMPLNHLIYSLMENPNTAKCNENLICKQCDRDDETSMAKFWCIECQEGLCDTCKKYHKRHKASVTHKVIPISEMSKSDIAINIPNEEPCPLHIGEVLKVFCEDHQEMCCVICISINHRRCEEIKTFSQMAESMEKGNAHVQLSGKLKEICTRVKSSVCMKQQNIDRIEKQEQDILEEATAVVEKVKKNLDKCLGEFKSKFSQIHKEQSTKLEDAKSRMEVFQKTVLNYEKLLEAVLEHGSPQQIFVTCEKIKKQLKVQADECKLFLKEDDNVEYDVSMDGKLTAVSTMNALAKIQVKTKPLDEALTDIDIIFLQASENTELQRKLKFADIANIGAVKLWDVNGGGLYSGGIFLGDGRLLCADWEKESLNVFDIIGSMQISYTLDYQPWDVVQYSDGRIFVSDRSKYSIRMYTLSENTFNEHLKAIKLQSEPLGLDICNGQIVVSMADEQMQILTLEEDVSLSFSTSENNLYTTTPKRTDQESTFYYCDGKDVICKTMAGKEVCRHNLAEIDVVRGIALDCVGNVYVCGRDSGNVYIVSSDFKTSHVFMSEIDGVGKPYAIGFDKSGSKLFISDHESGALSVFQLCIKK